MQRYSLPLVLLFLAISQLHAQSVQRQYLDSLNNVVLVTSDYMTYCNRGYIKSKSDERHSVSLNYYYNKPDAYYILSLPIVTPEKQEVRKGNKLKMVIQRGDTVTLSCSTDFISNDTFTLNDTVFQVVLPKYHLSEKSLRRLIDNDISAIYQEIPGGRYIRIHQDDYRRWNFSKTLKLIYREINKFKVEDYDADLLYNNGRYEYISSDTIVKTDRHINFSDKWMY